MTVGSIRISELAADLDVSEMTIRRDLDGLVQTGKARKVHGGAVLSSAEPLFAVKAGQAQREKTQIASAAAVLVTPGSAIGIGAGTTTAAFATSIRELDELTVVTNSIAVSEVFHRSSGRNQTVVLTGGQRSPSDALVGPSSLAVLRDLYLDTVFLGAHGLDVTRGLTTPNLLEAETNRAFVAATEQVVVLADRSKWGVLGLAGFARLDEVDVLVTDGIPRGVRKHLRQVVMA